MSRTLLNGVNEVLKKTDVLDSDAGLLTSLTDSARQVFIDTAVQVLNETVDELYSKGQVSKPEQLKTTSITLADGRKEYGLHSSLVMLRTEYPLIDETNNHLIPVLNEDGYWQIILGDLDQDDTGLPSYCAINPTNGKLVFDRTPTAVEAGREYKYRFDRDMELTDKDDEFPFTDKVFRAIIPAAAELWKFYHQQEFTREIWNRSMARSAEYLRKMPARGSYMPRQYRHDSFDPFHVN